MYLKLWIVKFCLHLMKFEVSLYKHKEKKWKSNLHMIYKTGTLADSLH